jgi:hypothetical protein
LATSVVLLNYDIASVAGDPTHVAPNYYDDRLRPDITPPEDFTPEPLSRWGLSGGVNTAGYFGGRGWATNGVSPVDPLLASTDPRKDTFFEVRVIVPPDHIVDLDRVVYSIFREEFSVVSGANTWELHASYDEFNEHSQLIDVLDTSGINDYFTGDFRVFESDLSALDTAGEISLRWFAYGGTNQSELIQYVSGFAENASAGSDVAVYGTFVPEPSAFIAIACGLLGSFTKRRRVRR